MILGFNLTRMTVTAFTVYVFGLISITLGIGSEGVSMVWLPSGLGLLLSILWGRPAIIGFFLGMSITELFAWLIPSFPTLPVYQMAAPLALGLSMFASIEIALSRYWIKTYLTDFDYNRLSHVMIYLGLTALSCAINSLSSVALLTSTHVANEINLTTTLITFWLGNWCGALLITPIGLAFHHHKHTKQISSGYGFPIIAVGLSLTLMASFMAYKIEQKARMDKFERAANTTFDTMHHDIELTVRDIMSMGALYYKVDISQNEFLHFATPILTRNPILSKLSWVPRVKHENKEQFENEARKNGFEHFTLFDLDKQNRRIPLRTNTEYFPILYTASLQDNLVNFGFNIGSNEARMQALRTVMQNAFAAATEPIKILSGARLEDSINIYLPIYFGEIEEKPSLRNEQNLRGFVSAVILLKPLLERHLPYLEENKFSMVIQDVTDPLHPALVLSSLNNSKQNLLLKEPLPPFAISRSMPVAGRVWQLVALPNKPSVFTVVSLLSLSVFAIGLGFTSAIAGFVMIKRRGEQALIRNEQRLSGQNKSLAHLTMLLNNTDDELHYATLTEVAATTLSVAQASVWRFNEKEQSLELIDLYNMEKQSHLNVGVLKQSEFPIYFANLQSKKVIDANDAMQDHRTHELSIDYLPKHSIGALLDVPILAHDRFIGVICLEHKGGPRAWTTDEKTYAESLRNLIALKIESELRRDAQQKLEDANVLLEHKVEERTQDLANTNAQLQNEITQHQKAEEQLKLFKLFAETATQGLIIARFDRSILYLNPTLKNLLQGHSNHSHYQDFIGYFTTESQDILHTQALSATREQGHWSGELALDIHTEHPFPVYANFFSLNDEQGIPSHLAGIFYDLTAQKEVEQQLLAAKQSAEAADRAKSMFIASMSHELRTPLNSIIGFTGVILQGLSGSLNERQLDQLGRVMRSAKHLLNLITDVIDISKIEAGYTDIHTETYALQEVLDEALHAVQPQRIDKSIELTLQTNTQIMLTNDKKRTYQVLLNLLSNAVKYTESGYINVVTEQQEGNIRISVQDSGIGMPAEALGKLFLPFERIDSHLRIKTPGTGLGLYLTKKITEDFLGGHIHVTSELDKGSTFTVTLPQTHTELSSSSSD